MSLPFQQHHATVASDFIRIVTEPERIIEGINGDLSFQHIL